MILMIRINTYTILSRSAGRIDSVTKMSLWKKWCYRTFPVLFHSDLSVNFVSRDIVVLVLLSSKKLIVSTFHLDRVVRDFIDPLIDPMTFLSLILDTCKNWRYPRRATVPFLRTYVISVARVQMKSLTHSSVRHVLHDTTRHYASQLKSRVIELNSWISSSQFLLF